MRTMRSALTTSVTSFVVVSVVFAVAFAVFAVFVVAFVGVLTSSYVDNGGYGELPVFATSPPEVAKSSFPVAGSGTCP